MLTTVAGELTAERDAEHLAERIRSQRGMTGTGPRGDVCNVLAPGS